MVAGRGGRAESEAQCSLLVNRTSFPRGALVQLEHSNLRRRETWAREGWAAHEVSWHLSDAQMPCSFGDMAEVPDVTLGPVPS